MTAPYFWVVVYNGEGRPIETSGPFKVRADAEKIAARKRVQIDQRGWGFPVEVREDQQFTVGKP